jgi:hypothetical protein
VLEAVHCFSTPSGNVQSTASPESKHIQSRYSTSRAAYPESIYSHDTAPPVQHLLKVYKQSRYSVSNAAYPESIYPVTIQRLECSISWKYIVTIQRLQCSISWKYINSHDTAYPVL